jgi:hypothetical protein
MTLKFFNLFALYCNMIKYTCSSITQNNTTWLLLSPLPLPKLLHYRVCFFCRCVAHDCDLHAVMLYDDYNLHLQFLSLQELIAALLACSFLCLFPVHDRYEKQLQPVNFDELFA